MGSIQMSKGMLDNPKRTSERKILPRLCAGEDGDDRRDLAPGQERAEGVSGFIGGSGHQADADHGRRRRTPFCTRCRKAGEAAVVASFEPGEMVRIKEGPFADSTARWKTSISEKSKLCVNVSIFGRLTPVELDFGQVGEGVESADTRVKIQDTSEGSISSVPCNLTLVSCIQS